MGIANGSQTRIAYIAESTFGTTPASPVFKTLRATQSTMRANKIVVTSQELRADRNVADVALTGLSASGELSGELSYGSWDDLLEGALMSSWATNVLKNGGTPKYFTIEETLETGATDAYSRFVGSMVDKFSMNINARQIVEIAAAMRSRSESTGTAILSGATYTAANTKAIQAAPYGIASLSILGSTTYRVKSLQWEINNGLRERPVVDSLYTDEMGLSEASVTGQIEAYFDGNTLYDAMLAHGNGAISFTIGTVTAEKYTILIPKAIWGEGVKGNRTKDADVMLTLPFTGVYDATEACSIKITRAVA